jgi:hypothetical protein
MTTYQSVAVMKWFVFVFVLIANSSAIAGLSLARVSFSPAGQSLFIGLILFVISLYLIIAARGSAVCLLLIPYCVLQSMRGFINGATAVDAVVSLLGYILSIAAVNYFRKVELPEIAVFIRRLSVGALCILFFVHAFGLIFSGHGVHGLLMIQAPLPVLALILLVRSPDLSVQERRSSKLWLMIALIWLVPCIMMEYLGGEFRPQLLPAGLFSMTMALALLFRYAESRSRISTGKEIPWTVVLAPVLLLVIWYVLPELSTFIFEQRNRSFLERIAIIQKMYDSMSLSDVIIGKGYAVSNMRFNPVDYLPLDIIDAGNYEYAPHSGIMVIFYENGIGGLVLVAGMIWLSLKGLSRADIAAEGSDNKSRKSRAVAVHSAWLLVLFWVVQNAFYVTGIPSPDLFFTDALPLYCLVFIFIFKSLNIHRAAMRIS